MAANVPARRAVRRRLHPNRIFFPRSLRDAIPDLPTFIGRDLVLDSIDGCAGDHLFLGRCVKLNLLVKETGKLTGEFPVTVTLSVEATRALAETLMKLADQAES